MSAPLRIGGFSALVAAAFGAAALAGAWLDPDTPRASGHGEEEASADAGHESAGRDAGDAGAESAHADGGHAEGGADGMHGLAVADGGLRLAIDETRYETGAELPLRFRILGEDGHPIQAFEPTHERRMHVIVVRRDLAGFQHLHPKMGTDGTWETTMNLSEPGVYRVFADFATGGDTATLSTDVFVRGELRPEPLPSPSDHADAGDGYEVLLEEPAPGIVRFRVIHNGRELRSVEPYLGADGHLVALREHDLAYLHVHPRGEPGGTGPIAFDVEYPSEGAYRLFFQFKHHGRVHTAAFTRELDHHAGEGNGHG